MCGDEQSHKCVDFAFEQNWHRELQDSFRHTYRICISIVIPDEIYSELLVLSQIAYVVVFYVSMLATPTKGISCSDIHTDYRYGCSTPPIMYLVRVVRVRHWFCNRCSFTGTVIVPIIHVVYMITYFVFPSP